jgi:proteasome lid subunit RPN8/RPN11
MSLPVKISEKAWHSIVSDLEEAYPDEGCGFVFGHDNGIRSIERAVRVVNVKKENKRRRFEISPLDYMKAEKYAAENNTTLLGVYHSHPDHPAAPSEHDLRQAVPFFSYIIVSVKEGKFDKFTSWQLNENGQFDEEDIINEKISINKKLNKII